MENVPTVVEHLRRLAQNYRDAQLALQKRFREMTSAENFLVELKQQEAALLDRFRSAQQQLLASLKNEELEKMLKISEIFDEIRVINLFIIHILEKTREGADDQGQQAWTNGS